MQESAWIAATLAGNTSAFADIVAAYERAVYNLAYRMLGDREDASDAAQESFVRAYARLASYDGQRPFVNWLLAIAAHYCIDVLRKRRPGRVDLVEAEVKEDSRLAPEDIVLAREQGREVRGLLDRLPPAYRLVVVLRYWHDMSCEEIGQLSGQSVGAVKTRLHRARALLAKEIEGSSGTRQPSVGKPNEAPDKDHFRRGEDDRALQRSAEAALAAARRPLDAAAGADFGRARLRVRLLPAV